jgi:16S rRNA (guanine966-N2)-methyltransferase
MFDLLGKEITASRVLDLFAGSGALGLEAISRGAKSCDFVEFRPSSIHAIKANIAALKIRERARLFKRDAIPFAEKLTRNSYDVAFADPPYESKILDRIVRGWLERRFSRVLIVEHAKTHELPPGGQSTVLEDTKVTVYR